MMIIVLPGNSLTTLFQASFKELQWVGSGTSTGMYLLLSVTEGFTASGFIGHFPCGTECQVLMKLQRVHQIPRRASARRITYCTNTCMTHADSSFITHIFTSIHIFTCILYIYIIVKGLHLIAQIHQIAALSLPPVKLGTHVFPHHRMSKRPPLWKEQNHLPMK